MNEKLLMSFEEYSKLRYEKPYVLKIEKGDQLLVCFGSKHLYDPADPTFQVIEKQWDEFVKTTEGKKRHAFVEGGNWPFESSRQKALETGEMSFVTHLAGLSKVPVSSPEPTEQYRHNELLKKFSKEEIAYHDFARMASQWNRLVVKPSFEEYLSGSLKNDARVSGWTDFDFSIDNLKKVHTKLFNTPFDEKDEEFFSDVIDPMKETTVINKLSRFEGEEFRDRCILGEIEKHWKEGENLFLIYGSSHVVRQEPVIRDFVNNPR